MSFIHKADRFVHKDLKPENIIVNRPRDRVYITNIESEENKDDLESISFENMTDDDKKV